MTLNEMRNVDVRTVDPETLHDRGSVHIDRRLPKQKRIASYLRQIGNPYCYLDNGFIVKVGFSDGNATIDDRLESCAHSHIKKG